MFTLTLLCVVKLLMSVLSERVSILANLDLKQNIRCQYYYLKLHGYPTTISHIMTIIILLVGIWFIDRLHAGQ